MIYIGDCIEVMSRMDFESVDLIYADPPFFTQRNFREYDDRWADEGEYLKFIRNVLYTTKNLLSKTGSLYLHCDHHMSHYIKIEMDKVFGRKNLRNEILWCYTGPTSPYAKQFSRKSDSIFWYSKGDTWTFNSDAVRIPYARGKPSASGWGMTKEMAEEYGVRGKVPENYWIDIAVVGRFPHENVRYPTQKPQKLLKRIIKASSNEGDTVLDPFCGSGSTLVAAENLGRKFVGIDKNPNSEKYYLLLKKKLHGELLAE